MVLRVLNGAKEPLNKVLVCELDDAPQQHQVTERYVTTENLPLRDDTVSFVNAGESYSATRPTFSRHTYTGYHIDNGSFQAAISVTLTNVQSDHIITFIYREDETDPGPGGGQSREKCCCGSLELKLNIPISNNVEMLKELTHLVEAAKGCDNSNCC